MTVSTTAKPVRLELNNTGSWKLLGTFDLADEDQTALVLSAAEELVKTLHNSEDPKRCPTLRVSGADFAIGTLARWDIERGWRDIKGEPL